jgi:Tol biopolymer transport system component
LKKFLILFFILIFFSFRAEIYSYKTIKKGENILITYDVNEGIIDWDKTGKRILFTSSYTGTKNIYYLDMMNIKFSSATKGFYTANYINEFIEKEKVYIPITSANDTTFECPKWSPTSNRIVSIGSYSGINEIFFTNRSTLKTIATGLKNVITVHWKSNSEFFFVKKDEPKNLYQVNIKTRVDSLILTANQNILGISRQKGSLYLACDGGVIELKIDSNKKELYEMNINGKTAWKLDRLNFIVNNIDGDAQIIDLNNGTTKSLFIGDGDGDIALSRDEKFVAFFSKFLNGIVIKKLQLRN